MSRVRRGERGKHFSCSVSQVSVAGQLGEKKCSGGGGGGVAGQLEVQHKKKREGKKEKKKKKETAGWVCRYFASYLPCS